MNRWLFVWLRISRKLWVRSTAYAFVAVAVATAAVLVSPWVPEAFAERFGGESVGAVLTILASSMLAVTTFSLGAIVTAYTAVSQAASPRVAELVTGDPTTQKALSTFVGAFLYAIVGVTALNANYYGAEGRAVVFVCSLAVVVLVAFRLLSWVNRLSSLARVGHMIELVENRTRDALRQRLEEPYLGGRPGGVASGAEVVADKTGYAQNVDYDDLQRVAEDLDCQLEVLAPPGKLVIAGDPLARLSVAELSDEPARSVRSAFEILAIRSFDHDPRFGLVVLGEIAAKALSPGVNDPGTAVQIISTGVRLLEQWSRGVGDTPVPRPRIHAEPLVAGDLLEDVFGPVMRYGAGDAIVAIQLQKALCGLSRAPNGLGPAATAMADEAFARSREALDPRFDVPRLAGARSRDLALLERSEE